MTKLLKRLGDRLYNQMLVRAANVYTADFETTSYPNLIKDGCVRVWLWSLVNIETYQSYYGYDIKSFLIKLIELHPKIVYFHNLKFDGSFLCSFFLENNLEFELIAPQNIGMRLDGMGSNLEIV